MNDIMVSIRMPRSLAKELKESAKQHHFLDLSEEIRSIVRKKWMQHNDPQFFEIKKLREDIEQQVRKKSEKKIQDEVAKELEKIKSALKNEDYFNGQK